jgi:hypothetical protein
MSPATSRPSSSSRSPHSIRLHQRGCCAILSARLPPDAHAALQTKFRVPIIDDAIDQATAQGEADMVMFILEERFTVSAEA